MTQRSIYWKFDPDTKIVVPMSSDEFFSLKSEDYEKMFEAKRIAADDIGGFYILTIFLMIDHNFFGGEDPILFETMVFDDKGESVECERCSTYIEAVRQHRRIKERVENGVYGKLK